MNPLLGELSVTFIPLDFVTEWARCGQTADYIARFVAYDFERRELAANILSTVANELIENVVKFSSDKTIPAQVVVRQFGDHISITTRSNSTMHQAESFRRMVDHIMRADPDRSFAERVAHPPEMGGAGIGLIVLRKDYGASLDVQLEPDANGSVTIVHVETTLKRTEVE
jgi:hypothetical protein